MIVLLHVLCSCMSLASATYLALRPSRRLFYANYGIIAATLISGTVLLYRSHTHMLQTCLTGLFYIGAVAVGMVIAQQRLARAPHKIPSRN